MSSGRSDYITKRYAKERKEAKLIYQERREYLSTTTLRDVNVARPGWRGAYGPNEEKPQGNSESIEDGDTIGNFIGSGNLVVPAEKGYRVTSPYGWRYHPVHKERRFHNGVDMAPRIPGDNNTKILAAGDGVVVDARPITGFGYWIIIKHKDDLYTLYGHMYKSTVKVKKGDKVLQGQKLCLMGSGGTSTGNHLHFEVFKNFSDKSGSAIDPHTLIDFTEGSSDGSGAPPGKKKTLQNVSMFRSAYSPKPTVDREGYYNEPLHDFDMETNIPMSKEAKELDAIYSSAYVYNPVPFKGSKLMHKDYTTRKEFLVNRIGWGRSTAYAQYNKLDPDLFIHTADFDGYEGNLYSQDAKSLFESLLLKSEMPYFEVVSGFRFSNHEQLSPHEAGCAIDILVRNVKEARVIADCAWQLGVRSIAMGGNIGTGKGFIHLDIAPKGNDFTYDEVPFYGGPGKWEIK